MLGKDIKLKNIGSVKLTGTENEMLSQNPKVRKGASITTFPMTKLKSL